MLENTYNAAGPLRQFRKAQVPACCGSAEPTAEDFADIEDLSLNRKHCVRSAVEALEPAFTGSGRLPGGFAAARALKAALKAHS
jgi:hypothetical protein